MNDVEIKKAWEEDAAQERRDFDALPIATLLERVKARKFGAYYQLWPAIAARASLAEAGWVLFDVLISKEDYLIRFHCAQAMLAIGGKSLKGWSPIFMPSPTHKYSIEGNLRELEGVLESVIGKRR